MQIQGVVMRVGGFGFRLDIYVGNGLIDMYVRCGELGDMRVWVSICAEWEAERGVGVIWDMICCVIVFDDDDDDDENDVEWIS
ncbi:hypothetical protein Tco_1031169 [Tanacetum coccineum]|uniref:Uncharacterized protein n=1 Tax=Tanacetum coccineum TaxID=301880 RepID=A0ABQ5G9C8_9ASTR